MAGQDSNTSAYAQQSIRFTFTQLSWLAHTSKSTGDSVNVIVRGLLDDAMTYYGLAPTMVAKLEKDREAMGLDFRRYVQELLTQRYRDVLKAEFEAQSGGVKGRK